MLKCSVPFRFSKKFSKMYLPAGNKKQKKNKLEGTYMKNKNEHLDKINYEDYEEMTIELIKRFKNKELLKRIFALAKYLYIYKDND